jgi:hypothetical protein
VEVATVGQTSIITRILCTAAPKNKLVRFFPDRFPTEVTKFWITRPSSSLHDRSFPKIRYLRRSTKSFVLLDVLWVATDVFEKAHLGLNPKSE